MTGPGVLVGRPASGITGWPLAEDSQRCRRQTVATMDIPQTRYVTVGDAQVAYAVVGEGPPDVVVCWALGAQVDIGPQIPLVAELMGPLAERGRLIIFDRRGSGASDALPLNAIPTWEELAEDLTAVLDAVGSERTALAATVET